MPDLHRKRFYSIKMGKILKRNRKNKTGLVAKSKIPSDTEKFQDDHQSQTSPANDLPCTATAGPSSEHGLQQIVPNAPECNGSHLSPAADGSNENQFDDYLRKNAEWSDSRVEPIQFDPHKWESYCILLEIHTSLLRTAAIESLTRNSLYEFMRTQEMFSSQWYMTPVGEQYASLVEHQVRTNSPEGKELVTGPVALTTPGDGWCLMRAAVGSCNLQLRHRDMLDLYSVAKALSKIMVDDIDYYSPIAGLSRSEYIENLKEYFMEKEYNHEVADVLPYGLSRALEVNIEINDWHAEMIVRIVEDEAWDTIVLDKTSNHYSQVVIVNELPSELIPLLKCYNFDKIVHFPKDEFEGLEKNLK